MKKELILFDLDGTVIDPQIGITKSVTYALNALGIEAPPLTELTPFIGPPLKDSFMRYYHMTEAEAFSAIDLYREYFAETGIFENTLYAGIDTLLKDLSQEKTVLLATSKPYIYAEKILAAHTLLPYFSFVAGSKMDNTRTAKAEVIAYALQNTPQMPIESCIMIGDKSHDIIGANQNNMDSIGVTYGYGTEEELTDASATYIVSSVEALYSLLLA
ncbi:MAG: HAD hydrolase-like protein [Christensenellaceae bacterium]|jgi:phosphoglycolate phosphatase